MLERSSLVIFMPSAWYPLVAMTALSVLYVKLNEKLIFHPNECVQFVGFGGVAGVDEVALGLPSVRSNNTEIRSCNCKRSSTRQDELHVPGQLMVYPPLSV